MRTVIYPGTFDPIHNGHLDIAERVSKLFDALVFVVAVHPEKKALFSGPERVDLIRHSTSHLDNIEVHSTSRLVAEYARQVNACAIIRGLRHVSDFEFEFQMAMMNYHLNPSVSTILMMPAEEYIHLNSSVVKDVARLDGDITSYVPEVVLERLREKFKSEG